MEIVGKIVGMSTDVLTNKTIMNVEVEDVRTARNTADKFLNKRISVKVKEYRQKRSRDANSYAWVLMQKIACELNITKWEVYLKMLKDHSNKCTYILLKDKKASEKLKELYREIEEVGEVDVNGTMAIQYRLYYGSSDFDTKEMQVFLDGIIQECKQLGIETLQPEIIEQMKRMWRNGKNEQGKG